MSNTENTKGGQEAANGERESLGGEEKPVEAVPRRAEQVYATTPPTPPSPLRMIRKNMAPAPSPVENGEGEGNAADREKGKETTVDIGGGVEIVRQLSVIFYCIRDPWELLLASCLLENPRMRGRVLMGFHYPLRERYVDGIIHHIRNAYEEEGEYAQFARAAGVRGSLPLKVDIIDVHGHLEASGFYESLAKGLEEATANTNITWTYMPAKGARALLDDLRARPRTYSIGLEEGESPPLPERAILGYWAGSMVSPLIREIREKKLDVETPREYKAFLERHCIESMMPNYDERTKEFAQRFHDDTTTTEEGGEESSGKGVAAHQLEQLLGLVMYRRNTVLVQSAISYGGSVEFKLNGRWQPPPQLGRGMMLDFGAVVPPEHTHQIMMDNWHSQILDKEEDQKDQESKQKGQKEQEPEQRTSPSTQTSLTPVPAPPEQCFTLYHHTQHTKIDGVKGVIHHWSMMVRPLKPPLHPTSDEGIPPSVEFDMMWFMKTVVGNEVVLLSKNPLRCDGYGGRSYAEFSETINQQ